MYSLIGYADFMTAMNTVIIMLNLCFEPQWGQQNFLFSKIIQTGYGAHQAYCTMGTWQKMGQHTFHARTPFYMFTAKN
jgi:hypothetical protein